MDSQTLATLVSELLAHLGARVERIEVSEGARVVVAVQSPDSAMLIGPQGEHLQALNMVARKLAESRRGEEAANFLIDINGYREKQLQTLRDNALLLAQRARLFKHDVELSPMSSYERLVIHELFSADSEIVTESQGEGKMRHVVLKYKIQNTDFNETRADLSAPLL